MDLIMYLILCSVTNVIKWVGIHFYHFLTGVVLALLMYLEPIKGVYHVMLLAIFFDYGLGIFVAYKLGKPIESKLMWRTGYKIGISLLLVSLAYGMDTEMDGIVHTHQTIAWGITGWELWSMAESGAKISKHPFFLQIKKLMENRAKDAGVEFKDKEIDNNF